MAEFLLSFAVEQILEKVGLLAAERIILARESEFNKELTRLQTSFTIIRAVLHDADNGQMGEARKLNMAKLKDIAYDVDDVLDDWEYEIQRRKIEIQNLLKKKVCNFFSHSNPLLFRSKMVRKIRNINIELDAMFKYASISNYEPRVGYVGKIPQISQYRETESFINNESEVVGRRDDVLKVSNLLVDSINERGITIIPIVGMGGLGKTTLAKLVYKEENVQRHFNETMWVWVSGSFDVKRILLEILEQLTNQSCAFENKNVILKNLQKWLEGKKYLLVLDGMWNEDHEFWDNLKKDLVKVTKNTGNGIIVTTRSDELAKRIESFPKHRHHLEKLSDDECWSIIKEKVFGDKEAVVAPDLEAIGKMIAKKCGGLPLVASVVGGTMFNKNAKNDWLSIQNSDIWDSLKKNTEILPILKLSFDHLPSSTSKQCFVYCSIFPKGSMMEKETLIQLWMAQGLFESSQSSGMMMEDMGEICFDILLASSLFQHAERDVYGNIVCKMHDFVHELAQSISKSESLILEPISVDDFSHVRHLNIIGDRKIMPTFSKEGARKLRSLFVESNSVLNMSSNFKMLRALKLYGDDIQELPTSIGKLKLLRYLDVSNTKIEVLPKSITKLYNLQTLKITGSSLSMFPDDLKILVNIRHLYFDKAEQTPIGVGSLTCLQTLPIFSVGQDSGRQIEELGSLSQLKGKLKICSLDRVRGKEDARRANLQAKTKLYKLQFEWSSRREREGSNIVNDEDVLEGLEPHPNLKSLIIQNFRGEKFSSWLMPMNTIQSQGGCSLLLENLVELRFVACEKCEELPALGLLPRLKYLEIRGMKNVRRIGGELYSGCNNNNGASSSTSEGQRIVVFPSLISLSLVDMPNLEEWVEAVVSVAGGVVMFPNLQSLWIERCEQLTTIPNVLHSLTSLHYLDIWNCANLVLIPSLHGLTSLKELRIYKCDNLISISDLKELSSLCQLEITNCEKLTCLPEGLGCLTHLETLFIGNFSKELEVFPSLSSIHVSLKYLDLNGWDKLKSLPDHLQYLTALTCLEIDGFNGVEAMPEWLGNLSSLQDLLISNCDNLMSIPDLKELSSLYYLKIKNCGKLTCLPEGLGFLTHLDSLSIGNFSKELEVFPSLSSIHVSLKYLDLYGWDKLKSLPDHLQYLTALTHLGIFEFNGVEALPEWLGNLSSLESLDLFKCKNLKNLPSKEAMQSLSRLHELRISECPILKERCAQGSGSECSKIAHIPNIIWNLFY